MDIYRYTVETGIDRKLSIYLSICIMYLFDRVCKTVLRDTCTNTG